MTSPDLDNGKNIYTNQPVYGSGWHGCTDTIWLNLTIDSSTYGIDSMAACLNATWKNQTFSFDRDLPSFVADGSGPRNPDYNHYGNDIVTDLSDSKIRYSATPEYRDTLRGVNPADPIRLPHWGTGNSKGCDSIISLWLKVYPSDTNFDDTTVKACGHYTWLSGTPNEKTYYSGTGTATVRHEYRDTIKYGTVLPITGISTGPFATDVFHCDSMRVLYLQMDSVYNIAISDLACDSFQVVGRKWGNGEYYTFDAPYTPFAPFIGELTDTHARRLDFENNTDTVWLKNDTLDIFPIVSKGEKQGTWNHTVYLHQHTSRFFCDSVVAINLTINKRKGDTTNTTPVMAPECDSACGGRYWTEAGGIYVTHASNSRDTHYYNLQRVAEAGGCDSTIMLDLYIRPYLYDTLHTPSQWAVNGQSWCPGTQSITSGSPYLYSDSTQYDTATRSSVAPYYTFNEMGECDSVHVKIWHVYDTTHTRHVKVECDSFDWYDASGAILLGHYYASTITAVTNRDRHNCDSTSTLILTVNYHSDSVLELATNPDTHVCAGFLWTRTGQRYYIPGNVDSLRDTAELRLSKANAVQCDSVVYLPMLLYQTYDIDTPLVGCDTVFIGFGNTISTYTSSIIDQHLHYTHAPIDRTQFGSTGTGCDSLVHYHITVHHADTNSIIDTNICGTFTWLDTTFNRDTIIMDRHFVNYNGDILRSIHGCDSASRLILSIKPNCIDSIYDTACDRYTWSRNHKVYTTIGDTIDSVISPGIAPNGCDRITVLFLHIRPSAHRYDTAIVCDDTNWYGHYYTHSIDDIHSFPQDASNGCDSIEHLHLVVKKSTTFTYDRINQDCDTFQWNSHVFTSDTIGFIDTISNAVGCDSIVTLNLSLKHRQTYIFDTTVCDSLLWNINGETYFHSTQIPKVSAGSATNGCDSIINLHLKVNFSNITFISPDRARPIDPETEHPAGIDYQTACDSFLWAVNDVMYFQSNNSGDNPRYVCDTFHTVHGCDSAVYLFLTIKHSTTDTTDVPDDTACGQFSWFDTTVFDGYNHSAKNHVLTHAVPNRAGCDSVLRIHVRVSANLYADTFYVGRRLMPGGSTYYPSVCDSFSWRGKKFFETGIYYDSVPRPVGCDSVYTLNVVIGHTTESIQNITLCNGTYLWHDSTYSHSTDSAIFRFSSFNSQGCDSLARLHLSIISDNYYVDSVGVHTPQCDNYTWGNGQQYNTSQTDGSQIRHIETSAGCDSVVHLYLILKTSITQTDTVNACDHFFWDYDHNNYDTSADIFYELSEKTIDGCDSARRLLLTINYSTEHNDTVHACEIYTWNLHNGETKVSRISRNGHSDANWIDYMPNGNSKGCDSTNYLILTIDTNSRGYQHREFCNILTWNNFNITENTTGFFSKDVATGLYTNNGSYYDTVHGVAANGCDSIYALIATTRGSFMGVDVVRACDYFLWANGTTYTRSNHTATRTVTGADIASGCDSIYTLNLTIVNGTHKIESMNRCDSTIWHGIKYTSPGKYIYNYTDTATGCPSVDTLKLALRYSQSILLDQGIKCNFLRWKDSTYTLSTTDSRLYRATNGCDSVVRMTVVIQNSDFDDDEIKSGCDSAYYISYHYDGHTFPARYYYNDTVIFSETGGLNLAGCPNMHRTHITVFPTYDSLANLTVCDSITWAENHTYYDDNISGVTVKHFSLNGCDSAITLNLTVNHGTFDTLDTVNRCDTYRWFDSTYTATTTARNIVGQTTDGCDSAVLQPIVIRLSTFYDTVATACDSFVWSGHARIFTASTIATDRVGDNSVGCDSNARLNITILHYSEHALDTAACDSILWHGNVYPFSGVYSDTMSHAAANGCDSIIYMTLTIHNSDKDNLTITECDSYTWHINGETYRTNTNKKITRGRDHNGCDSTAELHLTIRHSKTVNVYQHACDSFPWHSSVYRTSGNYSYTEHRDYLNGCDSTTNMRLELGKTSYRRIETAACDRYTWFGHTYTLPGVYYDTLHHSNTTNCDSVSILYLSLSHNDTIVLDTTACDSLRWFGTTYSWSQRGITNVYANLHTGCYTYNILNLRMGFHTTFDERSAEYYCDSVIWHGTTYRSSTRTTFDTLTTLGCDSTIRTSLVIRPSYRLTDNAGDQCGSYSWHGTTYTESNDTATFRSNNPGPNGCDTIKTLSVKIHEQGPYVDTFAVCNAYLWQGATISHDTSLTIIGTSIYGCDSTIYRFVKIYNSFDNTIDTSVCDSLSFRGVTYDGSGTYQRVFPSSMPGCDSVVTIRVSIHGRSSNVSESLSACPGYRWHGMILLSSTDTTIDLGPSTSNCDSTASIHFVATETARYTDSVIPVCDRFVWNGQAITADTAIIARYNMASGCDSLSLLHIFVRHTLTATDDLSACDSLKWRNGITYYGSTYTPTYRKDWGGLCDSIYTLHLTINRSTRNSTTKASKDYYIWDDTVLLHSGTYSRAFTAANGCDSIVTLRLTITDVPVPTIVCNDNKLLMINHYPYGLNFDRVDYFAYRWYRNGVLIPNANHDYYSEYGYTILNGCYYVEVAIDAEQTGWLPSEPFCIGTYGIDEMEHALPEISIMPNPVASGAAFTIRANSTTSAATLDIFDLQGRLIHSDTFSGTEQTYNLPLSAGIYTLRLTSANGATTTKKLIVK